MLLIAALLMELLQSPLVQRWGSHSFKCYSYFIIHSSIEIEIENPKNFRISSLTERQYTVILKYRSSLNELWVVFFLYIYKYRRASWEEGSYWWWISSINCSSCKTPGVNPHLSRPAVPTSFASFSGPRRSSPLLPYEDVCSRYRLRPEDVEMRCSPRLPRSQHVWPQGTSYYEKQA